MRIAKILILLALPGFVSCQAGFLTAGAPLLLDEYPGAAAAYSVHQINTGYGGSAIQVRRASDNATADIGFDNGELNIGQLINHCSGTNCFVSIWYDQSGNGRNATQTTAGSQPKIYDSSTGIVYENGQPALNFDGTDDVFLMDAGLISAIGILNNDFSFFAVSKIGDLANFEPFFRLRNSASVTDIFAVNSSNTNNINLFQRNSASIVVSTSSTDTIGGDVALIELNYTGSIANYFINGTASGTPAHTFAIPTSSFNLGGIGAGFYPNNTTIEFPFNGKMQTLIFYATDQTTNRTGIETNLNNFFSIY